MVPERTVGKKQDIVSVEILTHEGLWELLGPKPDESMSSARCKRISFRWHGFGTIFLGVFFTAVLHLALFGPMFLGTTGRPLKKSTAPLTEGASASAEQGRKKEFVSMLVLINERGISSMDQDDDAFESIEAITKSASKELRLVSTVDSSSAPTVNIAGTQEGKDEHSPTIEATGDGSGRELMFGRYMNQVKARIERAWQYPSAALTTPFRCQVQIKQDFQGDVKEVTLQRCEADMQWQVSLVQAIQTASPLSAPPTDAVFSEIVTLTFDVQPTVQASALEASW